MLSTDQEKSALVAQTASKAAPEKEFSEIANFNLLPDSAWIKAKTVCTLTSRSRVTLWREIKSGCFPEPIKQGYNMYRWRVGDVRKYLDGGTSA